MKIAVLGGSFNPIHIGHLHLADSAIRAFGFDRILLVPANISPFKQNACTIDTGLSGKKTAQKRKKTLTQADSAKELNFGATAADRLDMILSSITADPGIAVEDLELRRGGISYTIDTVKEIINRYQPEGNLGPDRFRQSIPMGKPALILGDDLIADFSKWKDAKKLAQITDIIIARRMVNPRKIKFPYPHLMLNNEVMDISSAMIRERIAKGNAWHYLVPPGARVIIEDRGLYLPAQTKSNGDGTNGRMDKKITGGLIAQVEEAARLSLSAKRFIHSRNTALMARDLALRYNLDADAAYLAGIAHDMAKNRSSDLEHGKKAAVLLQTRFNIHNKEVLEAVEIHTTGKPGMKDLAKVVFIADKIEFSRPGEHTKLRDMAAGKVKGNTINLDKLFYAVLKNNISWLKEAGIKASKITLRLLEEK